MVKKFIVILSIGAICALWRGASMLPDAAAQKMPGSGQTRRKSARGAKRIDYSKFQHSSHAGTVGGVLRRTRSQELKCDYCHQNPTPEQPVVTGYPNLKPGSQVTHSACIDCHLMNNRPEYPDMCLICHSTKPLMYMKKNIRVFPNPESGPKSQFYDYFSHSDHADYLASSKTFKELFKDKSKFKEKDSFECAACHDVNQQPVTIGGVQFAEGVKERAPGHKECFVCHFNEQEVNKKSATFATNCAGCHNLNKKDKGTGSELAALWFDREIVNTEFNPAKPSQNPGQKLKPSKPSANSRGLRAQRAQSPAQKPKLPEPFNHQAHMSSYDDNLEGEPFGSIKKPFSQGTQSCLICHETGKTANTRSDFYAEFRKTMNKQPAASSCVPCHKSEMQKTIGGAVTLESAQCVKCHALQTIKARKGVALPPPSHFKLPKPTPAPTPLKPPTPLEPAQPPITTPSGPVKPTPMGIIRLGDPKKSDQWGQHAKWGVVENFDHGRHIQPKYSERCDDCHHTNKNAEVEEVLTCLTCHKGLDHPDTANRGGGVNVKDAYHGVPGSAIKAGCIECHKRYVEKNPDSTAPANCIGCHTEKMARLDRRLTRPQRDDWVTSVIFELIQWMGSVE